MKKTPTDNLTPQQHLELEALANLPDEAIDLSDVPERLDWSGARRGVFYRPVKQQITLRLDADVLEWFRRRASAEAGYQTSINQALRDHIAVIEEKAQKGP